MRPSILKNVLQDIGGRRANVTLRNGHHHVDVLVSFDSHLGRVVMTAIYGEETVLVYVDCEDIVTIRPLKSTYDKIGQG